MYYLNKVFSKIVRGGLRWQEQDKAAVLSTDVRQLTQTYGQTLMVLEHSHDPDTLFLFDFSNNALEYVNRFAETMTVEQWLIRLDNASLPTVEFSRVETRKAYYADALEAGFSIDTTVPGALPNARIPWSERTDLILNKADLSPGLVEKNALFSVNGFFHRTYSSDWGLYVMQGGTSIRVADMNTVGVVSLAPLGGCETIPITESMISAWPADGEVLEGPLYVQVPDIDWQAHTPLLVLCGYLLPLGEVFQNTGNGIFELNLLRYPYLENFLKAEKYMDLGAIRRSIDVRVGAPSMTAVRQAKSAAFLKALLTISQSFIVAVKSPNLYIDKIPLETTQHPGAFLHHSQVTSPAVFHDGRLMNYHLEQQGDDWVLLVPDGIHDSLRMHDTQWHNVNAIDAIRPNLRYVRPGNCSILEIKTDVFL